MKKIKSPHVSVFIILAILLAGGALAFHKRIDIAYWGIDELAKKFDFPDHRLTLKQLDFKGIELTNIWLGPDLTISSLHVEYSLESLLKAQVDLVTIKGMTVDISNPETGALGKIKRLTQSSGQSSEITPTILPKIVITDMSLVGEINEIIFSSHINGIVNPNLSASFESIGEGAFQDFSLQGLSMNIGVSKGFEALSFNVAKGIITHQKDPSFFIPLHLKSTGHFQEPNLNFSASLSDEKKQFSLNLKGEANTKEPFAQIDFDLAEIQFSPKGLQPKDLSNLAELPLQLDAKIAAEGKVSWKDNATLIHSVLDLREAHFALTPSSKRNLDISGQAYLEMSPLEQQFSVTLPRIKIRHNTKQPLFTPLIIKGGAILENDLVSFDLSAFLAQANSTKVLSALGQHHIDKAKGKVSIKTPQLTFSPKALKSQDFSPLLSIIKETTGNLSAQVHLNWTKENLSSNGKVFLNDLSLSTDTVALENINSTLALSQVWPPRTSQPQSLKLSEISSGLSLHNPQLLFSLKGPAFYIHHFKSQFIGGDILIEDVLADPKAKKHELTLKLAHLDLEKLFSLIQLEGVVGTGQLTGEIPLTILENDLIIHDGILSSNGPGVLQFKSEKAKQALAGAGEQVDLLLRVLSNFHYEKLTLKITREASHNALVSLHIEGKNPKVMNARPFNLNINLEGNIDRLLETVMEGYRLSDRAIRASVGAGQ